MVILALAAILRGVKRTFSTLGVSFALGCAGLPAFASDIYSYRDENGVVHFTNIKGLDPRYKLIYKAPAPTTSTVRPRSLALPSREDMERYRVIIESAAAANGVDANLIHAVITAESAFNASAISPKGASGLMQLMPDTARRYGVRNIFDPVENIHGGVRYLRDLLTLFNGDVKLALAGYNAGENAVIRAGHRIPPYAETIAYVPKVMDLYGRLRSRPS